MKTILTDMISISYDCDIEKSERINKLSDTFGLNMIHYRHDVVRNFVLPKQFDIMYITGVSGSGKSCLLNSLKSRYAYKDFDVADMMSDNRSIIDCIGDSFENALYLLNSVGLSEAMLYAKKYSQLSEGQKYRFYLARLLQLKTDIIFVDEFASLLDRVSAKIVSYNYQKIIRRHKIKLIVATAHDDLVSSMAPSHVIQFNYSNDYVVKKYDKLPEIPFLRDMTIRRCHNRDEIRAIMQFHYKDKSLPAAVSDMFVLLHDNNIIGCVVFSRMFRSFLLDTLIDMRDDEKTWWSDLSYIDKKNVSSTNICLISRIVVHPVFRGVGVSNFLLRKAIDQVNSRVVLLSSVMSNFIPFVKCMTKIDHHNDEKYYVCKKMFDDYDIDSEKIVASIAYQIEIEKRLKKDNTFLLCLKRICRACSVTYSVNNIIDCLLRLRPVQKTLYMFENKKRRLSLDSLNKSVRRRDKQLFDLNKIKKGIKNED